MALEGYGSGFWGSSFWGTGKSPGVAGPPEIVPISPQDGEVGVSQGQSIVFRLGDNTGVALETLMVTVAGVAWVIGGVALPGITLNSVVNDANGYDVELLSETPHETGVRRDVYISVRDLEDNEGTFLYTFFVGVGTRLLNIRNPLDGMLDVLFNKALTQNATLFSVGNWKIQPVSEGAKQLTVTEVIASPAYPSVVRLRHTGGGSTYSLTALGILGADGLALEKDWDRAEFDIVFDEEEAPKVRLFNSVFGPLGVSQRARTRRTMDEFVANRSIALALDEQFRLRFQQLDNTVGRDGRPGKLRTA